MKLKLLACSIIMMLLSGCTTMGYIVETSIAQNFQSIKKEWIIRLDGIRENSYLTLNWSAEPSKKISADEVFNAKIETQVNYSSDKYPQRYLNIFVFRNKGNNAKISYTSFDMDTLMQGKPIMYSQLHVTYEDKYVILKYQGADISRREISSLGNAYYSLKPKELLEKQLIKQVE